MTEVQAYCKCKREHMHLAQAHQNVTVGDDVCKPVSGVTGVDCTLDGLNVTIDALKNIVTDKPAPITRPLSSTDSNFIATKLVQLRGDGSEDEKEEEDGKNAKNATGEALNALAKEQLKADGVKDNEVKPLENPMKGEHLEITMSVGGSKIELTKAAAEAKKKAEEEAFKKQVAQAEKDAGAAF